MHDIDTTTPRECAVADCDRRVRSANLCEKHYRRWQKHGDPLVVLRLSKQSAECEVEGCEGTPLSRNLCRRHYWSWHRHGDPLKVDQPRPPAAECEVDGCERPADGSRGWCQKHYRRWQKHGDPLSGRIPRERGATHCTAGHPLAPDADGNPYTGACRECDRAKSRERSARVTEASRALGLTREAYEATFDQSRRTAESIFTRLAAGESPEAILAEMRAAGADDGSRERWVRQLRRAMRGANGAAWEVEGLRAARDRIDRRIAELDGQP